MAYYLTIEKKKGEYIPLDITKSACFYREKNSKIKKTASVTLSEIDIFTTSFYDEQELRKKLLAEHILYPEYIDKPLSIRRLTNGKYKKVMYDLLYQDSIEYIMDPKKIIRKIEDKLYEKDFRFIDKLVNHYFEYHDCSSTLPEVKEYINRSIQTNNIDRHFYEKDENNDTILIRMLKLLIYEYEQTRSGRVEYKNKIKYRNLHSLIAFTNYHEQKHVNELPCSNQVSLFETNVIVKTKKRKQKNICIEGQINLFNE